MKITKTFLKTEYFKKDKTMRQIGNEIAMSYDFVRDNMIKFNIKRRNASDANSKYRKILIKSFLRKEFIVNKKAANKIA